MPYDPEKHHRRSIRLRGYDYTQAGAYFVTICTHKRAHLFGRVVDGNMVLNEFGDIVREEWFKTARVRPYVELYEDEFVVMPNHIHGIIWIVDHNVDTSQDDHPRPPTVVGAQRRCAPTGAPTGAPTTRGVAPNNVPPGSLGAIVRAFKSAVTKRINARRGTPGARVWQRNYYEHIIRHERALNAIRRYIIYNPWRWHLDRYNPNAIGSDPWAQTILDMMQNVGQSGRPNE